MRQLAVLIETRDAMNISFVSVLKSGFLKGGMAYPLGYGRVWPGLRCGPSKTL